jgi:DNA mismatch endonuclease, patch repair protein
MADVHDEQTRSRNMAAVKSKNTKPELLIRRILHRAGFRFRLHPKLIAGKPDIVLPRFRAAIHVNGCFWHGHGCHLFKQPGSRSEFWLDKIGRNKVRDAAHLATLQQEGWRTCTVWECALRGKQRLTIGELESALSDWLRSDQRSASIEGAAGEN